MLKIIVIFWIILILVNPVQLTCDLMLMFDPYRVECKCSKNSKINKITLKCDSNNKSINKMPDLNGIKKNWGNYFERIKINNKNISVLNDFIFQNMSIELLNFSSNEIRYTSKDSFSSIENLKMFIIKENKLESIENIILSLSSNEKLNNKIYIEELDFSNNQIEFINFEFPIYLKI